MSIKNVDYRHLATLLATLLYVQGRIVTKISIDLKKLYFGFTSCISIRQKSSTFGFVLTGVAQLLSKTDIN